MKRSWKRLRAYIRRNPARMSGYFSAFTLYLYRYIPILNADFIIFLVSIFIGMGEAAQRAEDKKTIAAIYLDNDGSIPDQDLLEGVLGLEHRKHPK